MATRVLVCDKRVLVRDGITMHLGQYDEFHVVGTTGSGTDAIALVRQHHPDVVLMSVNIRHISPTGLLREFSRGQFDPVPATVVMAIDEDPKCLAEVVRAGACALLTDDATREELTMAVRAAGAGQAMLGPRVAQWMLTWFREHDMPAGESTVDLTCLTAREREILVLTAIGLSTQDVARRLFIGTATVRSHIYRLRCKLQARDRAQLVTLAYQGGLLAPNALVVTPALAGDDHPVTVTVTRVQTSDISRD
jgi:DNA-binding NarL/FixJ family response regulator